MVQERLRPYCASEVDKPDAWPCSERVAADKTSARVLVVEEYVDVALDDNHAYLFHRLTRFDGGGDDGVVVRHRKD